MLCSSFFELIRNYNKWIAHNANFILKCWYRKNYVPFLINRQKRFTEIWRQLFHLYNSLPLGCMAGFSLPLWVMAHTEQQRHNYKCIFSWEKQLFCSVPASQIHTTLTQYDPQGDPCSHLLNVCWFVLCQIPALWTSLQRPGAPQVPFQSMHSRGRWLPGAWTAPEGIAQTTGKPDALSAQRKVPPSHVRAHRAAKAVRSWEVWRHFNSLCSQQLCQWQGKPL